ncbi:hypothetical protein MLP_43010 [Microlunatus phosphovorus NM-1]|uniref:Uncharacterized protein n=1 Tax=Microlunatus phosphovorus (strain ATCC 700054 / DSM 10555 / JCM 9379 / NBRC 101784 / NCIMB 13414 / VKM Ac-1990 / NM-1) TaxID=1032480 RepID=F5XSQ7_MICPN|nr:hypothetical protein MLP_43010 [Microlunatus phosphovorus NM-1]
MPGPVPGSGFNLGASTVGRQAAKHVSRADGDHRPVSTPVGARAHKISGPFSTPYGLCNDAQHEPSER